MPKLSGNKGEWSEIYVLFRLLEIGKLYAADADLNKMDGVFYNILNIIRTENIGDLSFRIDNAENEISIIKTDSEEVLLTVDKTEFKAAADKLYQEIVNAETSTFVLEDTEAFLNHIDSCPECREELEVTYSLMTAMKQLDADEDLSENYIEELNQKIETCYLDELKRKRSCVRRRILLGIVVFLLLFMNGITVKEERREEDRRFFRMISGTEDSESLETENEVMLAEEQNEDTEGTSEADDEE